MFGALFLLVAFTLLVAIRPPLLITILFVAVGALFVIGGISAARRLIGLRDSPIDRVIAVIVKERTHVSAHDRRPTTSYYTTLQTRDGTRTEFRTSRALVGRLVLDDIGVAYVKATKLDLGIVSVEARTLVEFIRFDA